MSKKSQESWGNKQDKIEAEDLKAKAVHRSGSLKKIKYCKKTKGEHEFEIKPYHYLVTVGGLFIEICKLCGKKRDHYWKCKTCQELHLGWKCPKCNTKIL